MDERLPQQEIIKLPVIPLDYSIILANNDIVFCGENHENFAIRNHLAKHVDDLKAAGITHVVVELPAELNLKFQNLSDGEEVDFSSDALTYDYESMIRLMILGGMKVVAVDISLRDYKNLDKQKRERVITGNIQKIRIKMPNSKILCLLGRFHTVTSYDPEKIRSVRKRFEEAGVRTKSVYFNGGYKKDSSISRLDSQISALKLTDKEFMIDNGGQEYSNFDHDADWIVNLPPVTKVDLHE